MYVLIIFFYKLKVTKIQINELQLQVQSTWWTQLGTGNDWYECGIRMQLTVNLCVGVFVLLARSLRRWQWWLIWLRHCRETWRCAAQLRMKTFGRILFWIKNLQSVITVLNIWWSSWRWRLQWKVKVAMHWEGPQGRIWPFIPSQG